MNILEKKKLRHTNRLISEKKNARINDNYLQKVDMISKRLRVG